MNVKIFFSMTVLASCPSVQQDGVYLIDPDGAKGTFQPTNITCSKNGMHVSCLTLFL